MFKYTNLQQQQQNPKAIHDLQFCWKLFDM